MAYSTRKFSNEISRLALSLAGLFSLFTYPLSRKLFRYISFVKIPVVIIGSEESALTCANAVLKDKYLGYKLIAFISNNGNDSVIKFNNKKFDLFNNIEEFKKQYNIKTAIIAMENGEDGLGMINSAHKNFRNILYMPNAKGLPLANTESLFLFDQDIFLLKIKNNLESSIARFSKNCFDFLIALILLPFILPIFFIIAMLIKKETKVIFTQERMGLNGTLFKCYKFQTMYENSDAIMVKYLEQNQNLQEEYLDEAGYKEFHYLVQKG